LPDHGRECAGVTSRELTTPLLHRGGDAGGNSRARGERESKHGSYATPRGPLNVSFGTGPSGLKSTLGDDVESG